MQLTIITTVRKMEKISYRVRNKELHRVKEDRNIEMQ
jgi:hypothetical protein